jgi:nucleotide-binding universal stress UspA family protein
MEIRSILVHLDVTPASLERHALAHELADRFDAKVTVLFGAAETAQPAFAHSAAAALRAAEEEYEGPFEIARARLHAAHRERDGDGVWCDVGRDLVGALVAEAVYADLLILGPPPHSEDAGSAPPGFVEAAILRSGTPTLVVAHPHCQETVGDRILVAWDGSVAAAGAVRAALPFLRGAGHVHVASWSRQPALAPFSRLGLADWLHRHGVSATQHVRDSTTDVGGAIRALAAELRADLIVMGCYGHAPLRERLFGGATRSVLASLPAAVLMPH